MSGGSGKKWKIIVHFWDVAKTCVYRHLIQRAFESKHAHKHEYGVFLCIYYSLGTFFNIFSSPPPCFFFFFIPSIIVGWKVPDQNTASYHKRQSRLLCSSLWVPVSFVESPPLSFTPTTPQTLTHTHILYIIIASSTVPYTTDSYGSNLHNGTMLSWRSGSVSSVANMSAHTHMDTHIPW